MTAVTENIQITSRQGNARSVGVAASTSILQGIIVCRNASGYAVPGADTAGLKMLGVAQSAVDNSAGSAGALDVIALEGVFLFANSGSNALTIADIDTECFVEDNNTVASTSTNKVVAGRVVDVTSEGVWVDTRRTLPESSHIVAVAAQVTTAGGAAAEAVTVTGALAADTLVLATIVDNASNDDVQLLEAKPTDADEITLLFNENPGAGVKVAIAILRART